MVWVDVPLPLTLIGVAIAVVLILVGCRQLIKAGSYNSYSAVGSVMYKSHRGEGTALIVFGAIILLLVGSTLFRG